MFVDESVIEMTSGSSEVLLKMSSVLQRDTERKEVETRRNLEILMLPNSIHMTYSRTRYIGGENAYPKAKQALATLVARDLHSRRACAIRLIRY